MKTMWICDSQSSTTTRPDEVGRWTDWGQRAGWAVKIVKSVKQLPERDEEAPTLALVHTGEGWYGVALDWLDQNAGHCLVILYSGAAPHNGCQLSKWHRGGGSTDVPLCAPHQLGVTLETVLTTWPPDPDYEWLFGTLCSESESEASLKALSALLPIGLLWEAQGTQERAVEELRKVDRANMPAFERQIQDYVCSRIAKDENHEARQRELLSQYSQWFEKLGGAETVLQQMDDLCNSETVASWNDKLAKLRDEWLKEPPS